MNVSWGARMSKVISDVLQKCIWKPMPSNSFITHLGTRMWSKLKRFVSNMKWHRVTNTEKDGASFIREDWRTNQRNRSRGNCRSRKCKAMSMDSWAGSLCQRQQGREGECGMVAENLWTPSVILLGFSLRDSEKQDQMSGIVPGDPFPTLHCSTSMKYQSKHAQQ